MADEAVVQSGVNVASAALMTIPVYGWAASAVLQIGSALLGSNAKKKKAAEDARNKQVVEDAKTDASNLGREGRNLTAGANGALARYAQSVNNQRVMDASASQLQEAQRTLARTQEARGANTFAGKLANAEQMGAIAANAAFNGVVGAGEMISGTEALRFAVQEQAAERNGRAEEFEISQRVHAFTKASVLGLDTRTVNDAIDYGSDYAQVIQQQTDGTSPWGGVANGVMTGIKGWLNMPNAGGISGTNDGFGAQDFYKFGTSGD